MFCTLLFTSINVSWRSLHICAWRSLSPPAHCSSSLCTVIYLTDLLLMDLRVVSSILLSQAVLQRILLFLCHFTCHVQILQFAKFSEEELLDQKLYAFIMLMTITKLLPPSQWQVLRIAVSKLPCQSVWLFKSFVHFSSGSLAFYLFILGSFLYIREISPLLIIWMNTRKSHW